MTYAVERWAWQATTEIAVKYLWPYLSRARRLRNAGGLEETHDWVVPLRLSGGEQTYARGDDDESGKLETTQTFAEEEERPDGGERGEL